MAKSLGDELYEEAEKKRSRSKGRGPSDDAAEGMGPDDGDDEDTGAGLGEDLAAALADKDHAGVHAAVVAIVKRMKK